MAKGKVLITQQIDRKRLNQQLCIEEECSYSSRQAVFYKILMVDKKKHFPSAASAKHIVILLRDVHALKCSSLTSLAEFNVIA